MSKDQKAMTTFNKPCLMHTIRALFISLKIGRGLNVMWLCVSSVLFAGTIQAQQTQSPERGALSNANEAKLFKHKWNSGAVDCSLNTEPAIELYQYSDTTYLLRQNKCTHYEAPFIYVLFGQHTVFVQDTGATADPVLFPLFKTISELVTKRALQQNKKYEDYKWLVTHSHGHSDHVAGDGQFRGKPNVMLVEPNIEAVQRAFNLNPNRWPNEFATAELGERELTVIPLPGHKSDAIAVYDSETQCLLTGDSLYPGRLYIKQWNVFRESIKRLREFAKRNKISALMGTHIEMSRTPGVDYKMGSQYQPNEVELPISTSELHLLNEILQTKNEPSRVTTARFIVYPTN